MNKIIITVLFLLILIMGCASEPKQIEEETVVSEEIRLSNLKEKEYVDAIYDIEKKHKQELREDINSSLDLLKPILYGELKYLPTFCIYAQRTVATSFLSLYDLFMPLEAPDAFKNLHNILDEYYNSKHKALSSIYDKYCTKYLAHRNSLDLILDLYEADELFEDDSPDEGFEQAGIRDAKEKETYAELERLKNIYADDKEKMQNINRLIDVFAWRKR